MRTTVFRRRCRSPLSPCRTVPCRGRAASGGCELGLIGGTNSTGTARQPVARLLKWGVAAAVASAALAAPASAATAHTVLAGETLSGIAAANGISTSALAVYNGFDPDYLVIEGTTIQVPAPEEAPVTSTAAPAGASAGSHVVSTGESLSSVAAANGITVSDLAAANGLSTSSMLIQGTSIEVPAASATATSATATGTDPAVGLGAIPSPWGDMYLEASAADAWNAMRQDSLANYGQDLYPQGPLSAYRTPEQQSELYNLYLSGQGAPANPPGMSSHQLGTSVDLATPEMRSIVDQIGYAYGWGKLEAPEEWWHVTYGG